MAFVKGDSHDVVGVGAGIKYGGDATISGNVYFAGTFSDAPDHDFRSAFAGTGASTHDDRYPGVVRRRHGVGASNGV